MPSVQRHLPGTVSSDLWNHNSLATGNGAQSLEFDNSGSSARWTEAMLEITTTLGGSPVGGAGIDVYMICAPDGTNYPSIFSNNTPFEAYAMKVGTIGVAASSTVSRLELPVRMLPYKTKFILVNRTGQTFGASGDLLLYPHTPEVAAA